MKNKNYADIRLKLGQKKIPDKYSKSINPMKANDDAESIPSDIEDDQWAEINKYDYELFLEQQRQKK